MEGQNYPDYCVKTHNRPRWMFRYPDENVKKHNRTLYTLPSPPQLTGCRDNRYNLQEILSGGERKVK